MAEHPKYLVVVEHAPSNGYLVYKYMTLQEAKTKYRSISVAHRAYLTKVLA